MRWISLLVLISAACAAEVAPPEPPTTSPGCGDVSHLDPCAFPPDYVAKKAIELAACLAPVCYAEGDALVCPQADGSAWWYGSAPNTIEHRAGAVVLCRIVNGAVTPW